MGFLISCPNCYQLGIKQNVGSVTDTGEVIIRRGSNFSEEVGTTVPGNWNKTVIEFESGTVKCGGCGAICLKKNNKIIWASYMGGVVALPVQHNELSATNAGSIMV